MNKTFKESLTNIFNTEAILNDEANKDIRKIVDSFYERSGMQTSRLRELVNRVIPNDDHFDYNFFTISNMLDDLKADSNEKEIATSFLIRALESRSSMLADIFAQSFTSGTTGPAMMDFYVKTKEYHIEISLNPQEERAYQEVLLVCRELNLKSYVLKIQIAKICWDYADKECLAIFYLASMFLSELGDSAAKTIVTTLNANYKLWPYLSGKSVEPPMPSGTEGNFLADSCARHLRELYGNTYRFDSEAFEQILIFFFKLMRLPYDTDQLFNDYVNNGSIRDTKHRSQISIGGSLELALKHITDLFDSEQDAVELEFESEQARLALDMKLIEIVVWLTNLYVSLIYVLGYTLLLENDSPEKSTTTRSVQRATRLISENKAPKWTTRVELKRAIIAALDIPENILAANMKYPLVQSSIKWIFMAMTPSLKNIIEQSESYRMNAHALGQLSGNLVPGSYRHLNDKPKLATHLPKLPQFDFSLFISTLAPDNEINPQNFPIGGESFFKTEIYDPRQSLFSAADKQEVDPAAQEVASQSTRKVEGMKTLKTKTRGEADLSRCKRRATHPGEPSQAGSTSEQDIDAREAMSPHNPSKSAQRLLDLVDNGTSGVKVRYPKLVSALRSSGFMVEAQGGSHRKLTDTKGHSIHFVQPHGSGSTPAIDPAALKDIREFFKEIGFRADESR